MADLNRVFLIGRLTHDPELRYTPNGSAVTDLRMAINRHFTTKDGDRREDTLYIDVVVWNRQAETCCQYLKKGRLVEVTGRSQERTFQAQDGSERRSVELVAYRVQFLASRAPAEPQVESGRAVA